MNQRKPNVKGWTESAAHSSFLIAAKMNQQPLREDQITNSVNFLTHPSVQSRSAQEKTDFLLGKGLSAEEVREAMRRAEAQLGGGGTKPASQLPASTGPGALLLFVLLLLSLLTELLAGCLFF